MEDYAISKCFNFILSVIFEIIYAILIANIREQHIDASVCVCVLKCSINNVCPLLNLNCFAKAKFEIMLNTNR